MTGELIPTGVTFGVGRNSINTAFSGTAYMNNIELDSGGNFSAGTGGGIISSGGTDLYNIFVSTADGNDITRVQPGSNVLTGGTANNPIISITSSPSFNSITASGSSSFTTLSATTIYSGGTPLSTIISSYSGTSGSLWSASTGSNSIISNNGSGHLASGAHSFVGGGYANSATTIYSSVIGGQQNTVSGTMSFIAGGGNNTVYGLGSTILGGNYNYNNGDFSSIIGGQNSTGDTAGVFMLGGQFNYSNGPGSIIMGGFYNEIDGYVVESFIIANSGSTISSPYSSTLGGINNQIVGEGMASIISAKNSSISSSASTIVGGSDSSIGISTEHSIILGGSGQTISGGINFSSILGGINNKIHYTGGPLIQFYSSGIIGGSGNTIASASNSVIIGGRGNALAGHNSVILGGHDLSVGDDTAGMMRAYIDEYIDLNPQTTLPFPQQGRMFFSGTPLFKLMINTGGTNADWVIV